MRPDDAQRLSALRDYRVLDSAPEEAFENIAQLVSSIFGAPIALVSLVDEHRQWFKAKVGLQMSETPIAHSFCAHAILGDRPLVVEDALTDPRFATNPLVTDDPRVRFYCGVPMRTPEGHGLGTLCILDRQPRTISAEQLSALEMLAHQVEIELEIRRRLMLLEEALSHQRKEHRAKELLAAMVVHDLRSPLTTIVLLTSLLGVTTEAGREHLADLLAEAEHMRRMLTDMLDVCLQDLGQLRLRRSRFTVQTIVRRVEERMIRFARQRDQKVAVHVPEAPLEIEADSEIFDRLLTNLILNAMQHGPADQLITITIKPSGIGGVRGEVCDQGALIPAEEGVKLFLPFDTIKRPPRSGTQGYGLGLAFCRLAAEAHGGAIGVSPGHPSGNCFHFELPGVAAIAHPQA